MAQARHAIRSTIPFDDVSDSDTEGNQHGMCPIRTPSYWKEVSAMCSGGGGSSYTPPKVDPAPTTVVPTDEAATTAAISKEQKRKKGRSATVLSSDRNSLLSSLGNSNSDSGVRRTLG